MEVYQILCAMRGKSPEQCVSVANLALRLRSPGLGASAHELKQAIFSPGGVVGLDLAGDEMDYPNSRYVACMRGAKQQGLNITVHSGEFETSEASDVRSAVFLMGADRIGHGYAAARDPELLEALRMRKVHLEVCPQSALNHGAWAFEAIKSFMGLDMGLNTDDPSQYFANTSQELVEDLVKSKLNFTSQKVEEAYAAAYNARFGPRAVPVMV